MNDLDENKLVNVFDMINDRLHNIEKSLKFRELRLYGEINAELLDSKWNFFLERFRCDTKAIDSVRGNIDCAYITTYADIEDRTYLDQNLLSSGKYDHIMKKLLLSNENIKKIKSSKISECQKLGIIMGFETIYDLIVQEIIDNLVAKKKIWDRVAIDPKGRGIWFWRKQGGDISDFIGMYVEIMKALCNPVTEVQFYDIFSNDANFIYAFKEWDVLRGCPDKEKAKIALLKVKHARQRVSNIKWILNHQTFVLEKYVFRSWKFN